MMKDLTKHTPNERRDAGRFVVMLLKRAGCGAAQVAREVGVTPDAVGAWTTRRNPVSAENLVKLVDLAGRYLSDLYTFHSAGLEPNKFDVANDGRPSARALARSSIVRQIKEPLCKFAETSARGCYQKRGTAAVVAINIDEQQREIDRLRGRTHEIAHRAQVAEAALQKMQEQFDTVGWEELMGWKAERDRLLRIEEAVVSYEANSSEPRTDVEILAAHEVFMETYAALEEDHE